MHQPEFLAPAAVIVLSVLDRYATQGTTNELQMCEESMQKLREKLEKLEEETNQLRTSITKINRMITEQKVKVTTGSYCKTELFCEASCQSLIHKYCQDIFYFYVIRCN